MTTTLTNNERIARVIFKHTAQNDPDVFLYDIVESLDLNEHDIIVEELQLVKYAEVKEIEIDGVFGLQCKLTHNNREVTFNVINDESSEWSFIEK